MSNLKLSSEQQFFIDTVLKGHNVLVEACIGSGKTTAIQSLCNMLPPTKSVLYLTYNRLLKYDAKEKIKNFNVTVTNYHGFVYPYLKKANISSGYSDSIKKFVDNRLKIKHYDILIIDEYQDIEKDFAELLEYIKSTNNNIQIVMVGDMSQKIYDKTSLNVEQWVKTFLDDYKIIEFTQCFRLQPKLAKTLGSIWEKKIDGVNNNCIVEYMDVREVIDYLSQQSPGDVLCLGKREGNVAITLNSLEKSYPKVYNKNTVYASIRDSDSNSSLNITNKNVAIFTTFDGCKGMERPICVVFDWDKSYWNTRSVQPNMNLSILKNIFCVAASRGKDRIIFVKSRTELLKEEDFSKLIQVNKLKKTNISEMFEFKYVEEVQKCYDMLEIEPIETDRSDINIKSNDGLIDLSPCIGIYQEVMYFNKYNIDDTLKHLYLQKYEKIYKSSVKDIKKAVVNEMNQSVKLTIGEKILVAVSLETYQNRYIDQVVYPFVKEDKKLQLFERLSTQFTQDEIVQKECNFYIKDIQVNGRCDIIKDNQVWELKFVSELSIEHYLQLAMYLIGFNKEYGYLWNTKTNELCKISIKESDKNNFLNQVYKTITKSK